MYTELAEQHSGFEEKDIKELSLWEAQVRKYALENQEAVKWYNENRSRIHDAIKAGELD